MLVAPNPFISPGDTVADESVGHCGSNALGRPDESRPALDGLVAGPPYTATSAEMIPATL
jgi:hypothetical protein